MREQVREVGVRLDSIDFAGLDERAACQLNIGDRKLQSLDNINNCGDAIDQGIHAR